MRPPKLFAACLDTLRGLLGIDQALLNTRQQVCVAGVVRFADELSGSRLKRLLDQIDRHFTRVGEVNHGLVSDEAMIARVQNAGGVGVTLPRRYVNADGLVGGYIDLCDDHPQVFGHPGIFGYKESVAAFERQSGFTLRGLISACGAKCIDASEAVEFVDDGRDLFWFFVEGPENVGVVNPNGPPFGIVPFGQRVNEIDHFPSAQVNVRRENRIKSSSFNGTGGRSVIGRGMPARIMSCAKSV